MFQILNSKATGSFTVTTSALEVPGGCIVRTCTGGPGCHSEALVFVPDVECDCGKLCCVGTRAERELAAAKVAAEKAAAEKAAAEKAAADAAPKPEVKRRRFKSSD